jgi:hypothetical protein
MGFARKESETSFSHTVVASLGDENSKNHGDAVTKTRDVNNNDIEQPPPQQQHKQHQQQTQHQHQLQAIYEGSPRCHLKAKLKSLLAKYNGCTKNNEVIDIVNQLAELNPSSQNCAQLDVFQGEFYTLTAPSFPGRILRPKQHHYFDDDVDDSIVQYTLGHLSFKIFQPNHLVCTLRSVRNPVMPTSKVTPEGQRVFMYHLVLDITIHTPDGLDLPATMINEAHCHECPDVNNRLLVSFTGGTLMPAAELVNDTSLLKLWAKTFEGAYLKADQERSYVGWFLYYIMKFFLGLTLPSDNNKDVMENSFHFDMKRSPVGFFDVLYLDEDIRITRGNRGTVVVVERTTSSSFSDSVRSGSSSSQLPQ